VLYAEKHLVLFTDLGSPGIVDPGDVLRYTITIKNSAAIPALGVALKDPVPANTIYVANSTLLNGSPVGQPDGGTAPLASGINVVITDDLNGTRPGQLAYVNLSGTVNGSAAGVGFAGSTITVDYGALNGPLAPGAVVLLKFRATLNASLALGTVVTNTGVAAWGNPTQTTRASVSIAVGSILSPGAPGAPGTPVLAVLNGSAWYDAKFDNAQDSRERALAGWTVELYRDNQLSQSVLTDANGVYRINGVEPNDTTGVRYELRFGAPGAGANTAMLGRAVSPFTNGLQRISDIVVPSGANLQGLNLAIHPNGVIYNSMARTPIPGATLTLPDSRSASP